MIYTVTGLLIGSKLKVAGVQEGRHPTIDEDDYPPHTWKWCSFEEAESWEEAIDKACARAKGSEIEKFSRAWGEAMDHSYTHTTDKMIDALWTAARIAKGLITP